MNRFDYVQYDQQSIDEQAKLKSAFIDLEKQITAVLPAGRATSLVVTKLEEAYMWIGKGIRDKQYGDPARGVKSQEERVSDGSDDKQVVS